MSKNKSFTLIELLVVIVIIGILAGVIMISTSSSIDKANFAKAQTFSNTVQEELLLNLVSEWTFDEGTDQTINRVATNNDVKDTWGSNNGTVYGNPQIKGGDDCVYGRCIRFNGVEGDYINLGNSSSLQPLFSNYTIEFWYKAVAAGYAYIAIVDKGNGNSGTQDGYHFWLNSSGNTLTYNSGDGTVNTGSINKGVILNKWTHVALSNNRTRGFTLYIDGMDNFVAKNSSLNSIGEDFPLLLGKLQWQTAYPFNGYVDEVKVYNEALSTSEIKQNYIARLNSMLSNGNISKQEYNERINKLAYD